MTAPPLSPWFSVQLTEAAAPWASYKGLPLGTIAALEAVGVLAALIAFRTHPPLHSNHGYSMPGRTYNKGTNIPFDVCNSRFPPRAVLLEIAALSVSLRIRLAMDWVPRELNAEAGRLAGGDFSGSAPPQGTMSSG